MKKTVLFTQFWLLVGALVIGRAAYAQTPAWRVASVSALDTVKANAITNYYYVTAMAADSSGNVYQAGFYVGRVRFGATQLVSQGRNNAFVTCWNPATAQYTWAANISGPGAIGVGGIAVTGRGIFITGGFTTGNTLGITASATFGASTLTTAVSDMFVAKLTLAGSFVWAMQGQASGNGASGSGIAVTGANVYVAGSFTAPTVKFGSTTLTQTGPVNTSGDSFVVKLTDNGATAAYGWVVPLTGAKYETVNKLVAVGSNVYVAGTYNSLATTVGSYVLTSSPTAGYNERSLLVAKLVDQGATAQVAWAWQGSGLVDSRLGLAATGTSLYLSSELAVPATFGSITLAPTSVNQPFVLRLDDRGTQAAVAWASLFGGAVTAPMACLVARGGTLYTAGTFRTPQQLGSTTLAATPSAGATYVSNDVYLAKLTDTGSALAVEWAIGGGGSNDDYAYELTLAGDSVFMSGRADVPSVYGTQVLSGSSAIPGFQPSVTLLATVKANAVTEPQPSLTSFSPSAGPVGTTVTLSGQYLRQVVGVSFNGVAALGYVPNAAGTSLTVQVPAGASSGAIRISTRGGAARSAGSFLVQGMLNTKAPRGSSSMLLVPNPAQGQVQLRLPAAAVARPIQVLDMLGREVYHGTLVAQATMVVLPTATLARGCYTVRCLDAVGRLVLE